MSFQYNQLVPVVFGNGAIRELGQKVKDLGCKKVLCVYDSGVKVAGIAPKAEESLRNAGVEYVVFDKIMGSASTVFRDGIQVPFVLFLTAGLVPWFFFSEALTNGTNALLEYNYLVKKVVFKISILPIIKVIAASFIHVFFVCILLIVAAIYGYYPTIYTIQLVYYSFCLFVLVLAISYTTCAVVVFFKDLSQIINIALQIGMWATPILWNMDDVKASWVTILKLNPLVYIVNGYRSAIYEKEWFFWDFYSTMYFWIVTVVLFGIGALVFKRLKVHFADVL